MAYCKKCGWELNTGANFCPNCGESTSQSSVSPQEVKSNEVTTSSKPKAQKATSTQKKTKVAHKRKRKEPIHYDAWVKIALVIGSCLMAYSLFDISTNSYVIWGANILGCLSIIYASVLILLGKSEIDNQGAMAMAVISLLWFPVMKGLDYLAGEGEKDKIEHFSDFSDVLPSNGSRMFIAEETKPYGSKNVTLKRIILYEKNDEMDYELEGVTSSGRRYSEKGGWFPDKSETYQAREYNFTKLCAGSILVECSNYFIDYQGNVYFCTGFTTSSEDVANAFSRGPIAKLRVATEEEFEKWKNGESEGSENNSSITIKPNTQEEKDYAEKGYNDGAEFGSIGGLMNGFGGMLDLADAVGVTDEEMDGAIRNAAVRKYDERYDNTTASNQERLKEIYIQHYIEGFKSKTNASNN